MTTAVVAQVVWAPNSEGFVYYALVEGKGSLVYQKGVKGVEDVEGLHKQNYVLARKEVPGVYCFHNCADLGSKVEGDVTLPIGSGELPAWSPDSNELYFTVLNASKNHRIFCKVLVKPNKDTCDEQIDVGREVGYPAISPDGQYMAFLSTVSNSDPRTQLFVMDLRQSVKHDCLKDEQNKCRQFVTPLANDRQVDPPKWLGWPMIDHRKLSQ
jgi:WD40-like Beta Propeller Repeat